MAESEQMACDQALYEVMEALRKGHHRKAARMAQEAWDAYKRSEGMKNDLYAKMEAIIAEHGEETARLANEVARLEQEVPDWHRRFAESWARAAWVAGARGLELGDDPAEQVRVLLEAARLPGALEKVEALRARAAADGAAKLQAALAKTFVIVPAEDGGTS